MFEKTIYGNGQGLGIISDEKINCIDAISVQFSFGEIVPGQMTDLKGMYSTTIEYIGLLQNEPQKVMVFYLGSDSTIFGIKHYYACWYYISETRIVNKYKEGTARDYNWINGKWK